LYQIRGFLDRGATAWVDGETMRGLSTSPRRHARRVIAAGALLLGLAALAGPLACGTDPVGVDTCRRIEKVRCESAPACGIDLERPYHSGDAPENDVAACIRFYDDQCLHGLVLTKEPGKAAVDACVDAIIQGDCSVVKAPESHPACKFLVPVSAAPADASVDASVATDAAATD
jgi:hypothetical protein